MRVISVVGWIGRMMIRSGVLVLLFVGYQLWGTGIHTHRAQDDLAARFGEMQATVEAAAASPTEVTPPNGATTDTLPVRTAPTDIPPPAPGEPIGRILIPDIGVDFMVVAGVDLRYLEDGPGHFPNTPMPGQPGNAALAGHRTTFAAPFHRIDELAPGALITVETLQGTFTYEVIPQPGPEGQPPVGYYVIRPTQVEILDDKGDNRLTLMACHPKFSAAQRIVVEARLVGNPAPPTPRPIEDMTANTFVGDELAGAEGSPTAAVAWSTAVGALWVGVWVLGRRWPKARWPAYAIALPLWGVLLYSAFEQINGLLPNAY